MMAEENPLLNTNLNKYLNRQELDMLFTHSKMITFSPGKIILQQGKQSKGIYLIINGIAIISAKLLSEGTTNLETLGPGSFIGESCFIEKSPCVTSIIANDNVQCLLIENLYIELLSVFFQETKYKLFSAIIAQVKNHLKKTHDNIIGFIANSDMTTRSIFGDFIQSFTKPTEISFKESEFELDVLKKIPFFQNFTADETNEILNHAILLKTPKNCTLIHKNEKEPICYIVLNGAVQSSIVHDNKTAKLSVIGPVTLFAGLTCIDNQSEFNITFASCEQAILLKLPESALNYFQNEHRTLWYKLYDLIFKSMIALDKTIDKLDIRLNIETYNR